MSLKVRYTLLTILITTFIVVAPIIILYTAGYRYNFVKNKIEKTGLIVVNSEPENATVFINGKEFKMKTEARIKNLLPDTYLVRVEKEGFHPWEKLLEVKSKLSTFAENIVLFKDALPEQIVSGKIQLSELSNDGKIMAFVENNTLKLLNLKDETIEEVYLSTAQIENISFVKNDSKILLEEKYYPHFKVIDLNNDNEIFIPKNHFGINFDELTWDTEDSNILYGLKLTSLKSGLLYKIDLNKKETSLPITVGNSFLVDGSDIYTTEFANNNDFLYKRSFNEPTMSTEITILPVGNYEFLNFKRDRMTLLHKDRGELIYINLDDFDENTILETRVIGSMWPEKGIEQLLIEKDFEILVQNFNINKRELVTRFSEEITKALWHPNANYIFFSMDNNIQVIELDSRGGGRNQLTLVNFDKVDSFFLDENAETIYFTGGVGSQEGIYKLEIK